MQELLESIYEPLFLECSYGFRPKRGCHDAIKALRTYLDREEVETVLDIDLSNFFGSIDHQMMLDSLRMKIKDRKFLRYVSTRGIQFSRVYILFRAVKTRYCYTETKDRRQTFPVKTEKGKRLGQENEKQGAAQENLESILQ